MNLKVNIVFISSLISALLSACTGGNNVDRNTNEEELESQQQSISQQQIYSVLDSLELVDYETGYYEYINRNSNILLYQPQIILKFKNKSSIPIKGNVEISAIFIKGDEEWSNESSYFQSKYTDEPLQPGLARQTALQSSVGWTNFMAIRNSNVSVRILMNGILYNLKSATKLFSVLLASKRPLITELADKLRLKYPLLPTISPCPTMRLEAIRSIIPISCRRYPKSV